MKVKIYIEGGGDGSDLDSQFREAWSRFFENAGLKGRMPRPVRGKGRKHTFDLFTTAVKNRRPDETVLMLVDSEDLVAPRKSVWQHLKERKDDDFDKPAEAGDADAFLMICSMETWLIADQSSLKRFFHPGLRENALREWPDLEAVPKQTVVSGLNKAIAGCRRPYRKGALSFELLSEIDPKEVEQRCDGAKRLFDRLRKL